MPIFSNIAQGYMWSGIMNEGLLHDLAMGYLNLKHEVSIGNEIWYDRREYHISFPILTECFKFRYPMVRECYNFIILRKYCYPFEFLAHSWSVDWLFCRLAFFDRRIGPTFCRFAPFFDDRVKTFHCTHKLYTIFAILGKFYS